MLVPIPIGALSLALVADVAYASRGEPFWARTAQWLLGVGVVSGALAAVAGATDFTGRRAIRDRPEAWLHAGGNALALSLSIANVVLRGKDARNAVVPAGLGLSLLTGAILLATGWLGGELSYRHKIGVTPD
jgi:uncharacterized membrane protein